LVNLFLKSFRRRRLFRSKGGTQKLFFLINDVFSNSPQENMQNQPFDKKDAFRRL